MIEDSIKGFPKQFEFEPEVLNADKLGSYDAYVIGGMGGSGLVAGLLRALTPKFDIAAHHEYGLPRYMKDEKKRLFIAVSYSGNTEETLDFFESAVKEGCNVAAISTGGKLMQLADEHDTPFVRLPDTGIQPRMSLGYMLKAVLAVTGEEKLAEEIRALSGSLDTASLEEGGRALAESLAGTIPIIYSSRDNQAIAYNWKIKFNETAKIPAFYNTFPELNHNEMTGFDVHKKTRELSEKMTFVIIKDTNDHSGITRRMEVLERLYKDRGLSVIVVELEGGSRAERIFSSLSLADWAALHTARYYDNEPEQVPMVEEFKKLIA